MVEQTLSVITNRGCHWNCDYCYTKKSMINVCKKFPRINQIEKEIGNNKIISVSGGGDPLWDYQEKESQTFYESLLSSVERNNLKFELHTSLLEKGIQFSQKHNVWLMAFHVLDYKKIPQYFSNADITRIVIVNEKKYKVRDYFKMLYLFKKNKKLKQFSIRQLVDGNGAVIKHNEFFLKVGHKLKLWYYILQGDYNEYFVNNKKIKKFSMIKKFN